MCVQEIILIVMDFRGGEGVERRVYLLVTKIVNTPRLTAVTVVPGIIASWVELNFYTPRAVSFSGHRQQRGTRTFAAENPRRTRNVNGCAPDAVRGQRLRRRGGFRVVGRASARAGSAVSDRRIGSRKTANPRRFDRVVGQVRNGTEASGRTARGPATTARRRREVFEKVQTQHEIVPGRNNDAQRLKRDSNGPLQIIIPPIGCFKHFVINIINV